MPAALALFLASVAVTTLGLSVRSASDIESRRSAVQEMRRVLDESEALVRAARERAERERDIEARARAELALDQLRLVRARTNPAALQRDVESTYESFREAGVRSAVLGLAPETYGVVELFEAAVAVSTEREADLWPLVERVRDATDALRERRPLPSEVGEYLAAIALEDTLRDNPQLAGEDDAAARQAFLCAQVQQRLRGAIAGSADLDAQRGMQAAIGRACAQGRLGGELNLPMSDFPAGTRVVTNDVSLRLGEEDDGATPVSGEARFQLRMEGEGLAEFRESFEQLAAGVGAGAAVVASGGAVRDTPTTRTVGDDSAAGCHLEVDVVVALHGSARGASMRGTARPERAQLVLACPGRTREQTIGNLRFGDWRATRAGDGWRLTMTVNGQTVTATVGSAGATGAAPSASTSAAPGAGGGPVRSGTLRGGGRF
ncbi:MAG: hypothetical protein H6726_21080 [Sandaracinaceae bacterium]|nr:hypothetical protein [Sandaracinaceae bacterium]